MMTVRLSPLSAKPLLPRRWLAGQWLALPVLLLPLLLTGCETAPPPAGMDLDKRFPLQAQPAQAQMMLTAAPVAGQLDRLAENFVRRGQGRLRIDAGAHSDDDLAAQDLAQAVAAALLQAGLHRDELELFLLIDDPEVSPGSVRLRFSSSTVIVPSCADLGEGDSVTPNRNFGCSLSRNTGLMLTNPAEITTPRPLDPADSARQAEMLRNYQAGQPGWGPPLPWTDGKSSGGGAGGAGGK